MYQYFLPFSYLISSRLKTKYELLSWQIIFFIPLIIITYFFLEIRSNLFIHLFLVSQIIFYSLYETGYIENDIITTKKETNPTIRLNKIKINFITKNYFRLISFRFLVALFFIIIIFWLDSISAYRLNLMNFLILLILTRIIFYIHNNIRNRLTIITFFLLSILKYTFPIILFINEEKIFFPLLLTFITFPLLRTIEVTTLKRYNFKKFSKLVGDIDKFRILYYLFVFIILFILKMLSILNNDHFYLSLTIISYFLVFRICCFYLIKHGSYKRDRKKKF